MREKGVGLPGGVYETPLHQQPVFKDVLGEFPVANDVCNRHICLPIYFGLTEDDGQFVIDALCQTLSEMGVDL